MNSIEASGYIVVDKHAGRVQGSGMTEDEAWSDMRARFESARVAELDEGDCSELGWRQADMKILAATQDLLKDANGNTTVHVVSLHGYEIACTEDEFDDYQESLEPSM